MKIVRKAVLSVVAGIALVTAAAAFARDLPPGEPKAQSNTAMPALHLPPTYFGPTYSAAAVYGLVRSREAAANARVAPSRPHKVVLNTTSFEANLRTNGRELNH